MRIMARLAGGTEFAGAIVARGKGQVALITARSLRLAGAARKEAAKSGERGCEDAADELHQRPRKQIRVVPCRPLVSNPVASFNKRREHGQRASLFRRDLATSVIALPVCRQ